ncbi:MAG TPA: Bax inhibitor-1 family protein [Kiritimatiellia bacterium]|nr:Bax inhibitor-1 family protein [Kiritimatiellia bacterium]
MSTPYYNIDQALNPAVSSVASRSEFIMRTYHHVFGAILGFVGLQILFFKLGWADQIAHAMLSVNWLWILGAFMVVGWLATHTAHTAQSLPAQYLALGGFVLAEAIIFIPMLYIANHFAPGAIASAAWVTFAGFAALTGVAFATRKNFSFLGSMLRWSFIAALIAIVAGLIFGFHLGTWFSVLMVFLAGAAVLYDTSNIIHEYPEDRYVGAALALFASIALMFWYVLRFFIDRR